MPLRRSARNRREANPTPRLLDFNHRRDIALLRDAEYGIAMHIGDEQRTLMPARTLKERAASDKASGLWHTRSLSWEVSVY